MGFGEGVDIFMLHFVHVPAVLKPWTCIISITLKNI